MILVYSHASFLINKGTLFL